MNFKKYLFFLMIFLTSLNFVDSKDYSILEEEKFGEKIAKEIEKEYKILELPEKIELLERICEEIGKHTERQEIKYKVKIIDETEINAFSLPGGYIYVNRRIFDFVESEDELAGVLAHEIAHIVHRHSLKKLEKDKKLFAKTSLGAILTMIILDKDAEIGPIIAAANAIKTDALSGYGRKMEEEADSSAIKYLCKTKYNPVGYLIFMEKLLEEEKRKPYVDMGIYKTHPDTEKRIKNIIFLLKKLNIPIQKNNEYRVKVKDGKIFINEFLIFAPLAEAEGISPEERAEKYCENLKSAIDKKIRLLEWRIVDSSEKVDLFAGNEKILTIYQKDAELQNTSLNEIAQQVFLAIKKVFWEEFSKKIY